MDVAAALASRRSSALQGALLFAGRVCDPVTVDEVLLQSHLFVGFPITLEAFFLWRRIAPGPAGSVGEESPKKWEARGVEVCRTVYGGNYEKLRANVSGLHPDLDRWMVTGGYGRVIGRPGLDLATRELCIVALLAVWNSPRQLFSHVRGARNAGASAAEVLAAVEVASRHLSPTDAEAVMRLAREALRETGAS